MRCLAGIVGTLVVVSVLAGAAVGADVGANDDTGKYAVDGGAAFYQRMRELGLKQAVITVRWQPSDGDALIESDLLDATVPAAESAGLRVVFAVYPYPPREIESGIASPAGFAAWLDRLARRYPTVKQYVVGNEPNQPAFFRPQFSRKGRLVSAARFGPFLAAGYDALKAVDPTITVVGVGLSPRGNDRPNARSNVSTSPIRFLAALGAWYRSTMRDRPLMDGFSFHPYPNQSTDPLERGYPWPNAGFVNLGRIKQALWDAFSGTAQPTTREGLRLYLDEVGWQVDTAGLPGYTGAENVRVTTDARQSAIYAKLVQQSSCDVDIAGVNVFGFYDDPKRAGFQAALHRADGSPRASAEALRTALSSTACDPVPPPWEPSTTVVGAVEPTVVDDGTELVVQLAAAEGARVVACVFAGIPYLAASIGAVPGCTTATLNPVKGLQLRFERSGASGVLVVRMTATANPGRVFAAAQPFP